MGAVARVERKPDAQRDTVWMDVCAVDDLVPGTGGAALVNGEQIAVVRARDGRVFALSNFDPFSEAFVIARGIVGDRARRPKIASPIYKQSFDLETGVCLDDASVVLPAAGVSGDSRAGREHRRPPAPRMERTARARGYVVRGVSRGADRRGGARGLRGRAPGLREPMEPDSIRVLAALAG